MKHKTRETRPFFTLNWICVQHRLTKQLSWYRSLEDLFESCGVPDRYYLRFINDRSQLIVPLYQLLNARYEPLPQFLFNRARTLFVQERYGIFVTRFLGSKPTAGRYQPYRHFNTCPERRMREQMTCQLAEEGLSQYDSARRKKLPDEWDDVINKGYIKRNWKSYRKHQWK